MKTYANKSFQREVHTPGWEDWVPGYTLVLDLAIVSALPGTFCRNFFTYKMVESSKTRELLPAKPGSNSAP